MTLALVPVKPFERAKTRLAGMLTPAQRRMLAEALLADVLAVLYNTRGLERIVVLSSDPVVMRRAFEAECEIWPDPAADLNGALSLAAARCRREGIDSLLVLHADLPLLRGAELETLLAAAPTGPGVVLAAAYDGGTNALLVRPPDALAFFFGQGSLERHQEAAQRAGLPQRTLRLPGLTYDLDRPEDLRRIVGMPGTSRTWRLLQTFGVIQEQMYDNHWLCCGA